MSHLLSGPYRYRDLGTLSRSGEEAREKIKANSSQSVFWPSNATPSLLCAASNALCSRTIRPPPFPCESQTIQLMARLHICPNVQPTNDPIIHGTGHVCRSLSAQRSTLERQTDLPWHLPIETFGDSAKEAAQQSSVGRQNKG